MHRARPLAVLRVLPALLVSALTLACSSTDTPDAPGDARGTATAADARDDGGAPADASSTAADAATPAVTFSGEATYYDADGTGACGFRASADFYVVAMNGAQYAKADCGKCVSVVGPNGAVVVRIVDKCPGCAHGDLDLSMTAFGKIAKLGDGRVPITWRFVPCP